MINPAKVKLTIEVTAEVRDKLLDESIRRRKSALKTWSLGTIIGEAVLKVYSKPAAKKK
jgi:hypothetical protein